MARQRIPGLSYIPVDNLHDEDSFQCVGFNLKVFTVPGAHKYGNCRPVTEFQKLRTIAQGQFGTVYKVRDTTNYEVYALKKLRIPNSGPDNPQGDFQESHGASTSTDTHTSVRLNRGLHVMLTGRVRDCRVCSHRTGKDKRHQTTYFCDTCPEKPAMHIVLPQKFLRQINNLKVIRHLNIVNLKEVVVGKNLESNYLLLDLCEYSLENIIDQVDAVFLQHRHIKNIMHQMLAGLQFIHRFNVVHRDLCPKNILFTETGILKIGDFGSTRTASDVDMTPNHGLCWYRAPEILFGSNKYTKAVDVWAVGCIFAEMMRQKPLFHGKSEGDIVRSMLNLLGSPSERHWPGFSDLPVPRLYRLKKQPYNRVRAVFNNQTLATVAYLMKFLQYNPASRPSIEDVMEDRYYEEYPHDCPNEVLIVTLRMSGKL